MAAASGSRSQAGAASSASKLSAPSPSTTTSRRSAGSSGSRARAMASWSKPRKRRGTTSTLASPWRSMKDSSRWRKIGISGLSTAPRREQAVEQREVPAVGQLHGHHVVAAHAQPCQGPRRCGRPGRQLAVGEGARLAAVEADRAQRALVRAVAHAGVERVVDGAVEPLPGQCSRHGAAAAGRHRIPCVVSLLVWWLGGACRRVAG